MKPQYDEYLGHRIEVRPPKSEPRAAREAAPAAAPELFIDGEPVRYGQHPTGEYYLHEYAYDPRPELIELARKFIDYRTSTDTARRRLSEPGEG